VLCSQAENGVCEEVVLVGHGGHGLPYVIQTEGEGRVCCRQEVVEEAQVFDAESRRCWAGLLWDSGAGQRQRWRLGVLALKAESSASSARGQLLGTLDSPPLTVEAPSPGFAVSSSGDWPPSPGLRGATIWW
jgi:hypothetical protein